MPVMDAAFDQSTRHVPHEQTAAAVVAALGTDRGRGLSAAEAQSRLDRFRRNELAVEKPTPAWRKFLAQFTHVLVILLMVAAAVSAALWLSMLLQLAAVHVPFLQQAFSTVSLHARDWLLCFAVASSVLWLRELEKLVLRAVMRRPGATAAA